LATLIDSRRAYGDLQRVAELLEDAGPIAVRAAIDAITEAVELLERHPLIGRPVEHGFRELVISRGKTGYVALYEYRAAEDLVLILAIRHQREAGYPSDG
jgi:plasmid stabilization system protein ParE